MPVSRKKFLFVINKKSGTDASRDMERKIRNFFEANQFLRFYYLPSKTAMGDLKKLISDFYPDCVVAIGGDGTVNLLARLLRGKKNALGIIPSGSANGMARELGIPSDFNEAMKLIRDNESMPVDMIAFDNGHFCLHLADFGLNAQLVKYFQRGRVRGLFGYSIALFKALIRRKNYTVTVDCGDKKITEKIFMLIVANASQYGTGATVNPNGLVHDGRFELVIVRRIALSEIVKMFARFTRFNPHVIEIVDIAYAHIQMSKPVHFQTDGEYLGKINSLKCSVVPAAVNLIVPEATNVSATPRSASRKDQL